MTVALLFAATLLTTAPYQVFECRDGGKPWTFAADDADAAKGGWVTVDFTVAWTGIVRERPAYAWSGVVFAAKAEDPAGKRLFLKTVNLGDGDRAERPGKMRFLLPKDSRKFTISFGPQFAKGSFTLKDVTVSLNAVDPAHPSISYKGKSYEYDERGKPPAEPAMLPADAAFGLFRVDSPRMTFDRFAPEAGTLTNRFALVAAPGETADLFVGAYASHDVSLSVSPGKFVRRRGPFGMFGAELGASPEVFRAHNRPNTAGRGQTYWIAPEVLVPFADMPRVEKGKTALALVQFRIPSDASPGVYDGTVAFSADGETLEAQIRLSVLPVKVPFPAPEEYQTILHVSWYGDDPAVFERVCRDARARGVESLLIPCAYGNGRLELERREGRLAVRRFDRFDHALAAFRAAGMKGTFYCHLSDKLEVAVAKALGIPFPDRGGEQTNMISAMATAEFKSAQVEALRLLKERAGEVPFAILGMDEPDNAGRLPRATWEIERMREAGVMSALYAGASSYMKTHPDVIIGGGTVPGAPLYDEFMADVAKHGSLVCRYGGTGSYGYAFGGLMPSRILHGWGEYLTPECKGHTIWTVQIDAPYDPDSVSHFTSFGSVYQRTADGRLLSSLQLEGCYEGMLDYAYLKELERRLAAAGTDGKASRIAAEFEKLKERARAAVPYRLDADRMLDPEKAAKARFTNADAAEARRKVARWICELD
ncbi:MAG: hypothetical protein IJI35_17070 [Kiritimatiellae bacterium]|nr:hypothetical protein [Kiritimatiellia bacterium]